MTGPEVTAAMKAEDVDAAWVEKAAQAMYEIDERSVGTLDLHPWSDVIEDHKETWRVMARHALAATLPLIVAKAFQDAADETERYGADTYWRDDSPFHAQGRFHATEHAKRLRAGAAGWLITTTEEPTA